MMKKILLCLMMLPFFVHAQQHLMIEGSGGNFYLLHKTAPKENYYSIGRMYNVSPKEIAPYNKLVLDKGVNIGQEIKIPLKNVFSSSQHPAADEVSVPVYHKVAPKETLSQLSTRYNKVPLASLKTWNGLKTDAVPAGSDLVVGFINVKKDLSPLAGKGAAMPVVVKEKEVIAEKPVAKQPAETAPVTPAPVVKKEEPVKEIKEEKTVTPVIAAAGDYKGGVFKNQYSNSGKEEKGSAGVFKSTSGWEDGKYYCLMNNALPNTIVKITNNATGKTIYAKVLDTIPDLKQNNNLLVCVSNAAGDVLGGGMNNFDCTINY